MTIKIRQNGGDKSNLSFLKKSTTFFAKQLMSTRMVNSLNITVSMRTSGRGVDVEGHVFTNIIGSKPQREFYINCNRDSTLLEQLVIIAHEMIHVQQIATNRYQLRNWKTDQELHARWEGQELGCYRDIPYEQQPWEIEAHGEQNKLVKSFFKHHENNYELVRVAV